MCEKRTQKLENPGFKPLVEPLDISRRFIYQEETLDIIRVHFADVPAIAVVGMNGVLADPYTGDVDLKTLAVNPQAAQALETLAQNVPVVVWTTTPKDRAAEFLKAHDLEKYVTLLIAKENYVFRELHDDHGQLFMSSVQSATKYPYMTVEQRQYMVYPNMDRVHQGSFKLPRLIWDFSKKIIHFEDQMERQRTIAALNKEVFPNDKDYHFIEVGRFNVGQEEMSQPVFSEEVVLEALSQLG